MKVSQIRMSRAEYAEYLKSEHWLNLRKIMVGKFPICQICSSNPTSEVHHLRYRNIYDVKLSDLVSVCGSCHHNIHSTVPKSISTDFNLKQLINFLNKANKRVEITQQFIDNLNEKLYLKFNLLKMARGILKVLDLNNAVGKKISANTMVRLESLCDYEDWLIFTDSKLPDLAKFREMNRMFELGKLSKKEVRELNIDRVKLKKPKRKKRRRK